MDLGEEDLFAVFDNESGKSKLTTFPDSNDDDNDEGEEQVSEKPIRFDAGPNVVEVCGGKRTCDDSQATVKKMKTDEMTIMTGLTDVDLEANMKKEDFTVRYFHSTLSYIITLQNTSSI